MNSLNKTILQLIIFLISFSSILSNGCKYINEKDEVSITNANFLDLYKDTSLKRLACYSLSNDTNYTQNCCYDETEQQCIIQEDLSNLKANVSCPTYSLVPNTCGLAYFYQPDFKENCTDISLVNGYCCYAKGKYKGNDWKACIRFNELNDDKKPKSTDIINAISKQLKLTLTDITYECNGLYTKLIWNLFIIGIIFTF